MQEPRNEPVQEANEAPLPARQRVAWQTPIIQEISRFDILDTGPTPGTTENFTFSNKSG